MFCFLLVEGKGRSVDCDCEMFEESKGERESVAEPLSSSGCGLGRGLLGEGNIQMVRGAEREVVVCEGI